jgi:hypothetical protein
VEILVREDKDDNVDFVPNKLVVVFGERWEVVKVDDEVT